MHGMRSYLHSTMYLLNLPTEPPIHNHSQFTFHYVSIKSVLDWEAKNNPLLFTFHYVSIKSLCGNLQMLLEYKNLHSTMYLLNLALPSASIAASRYLHSTMYLLNHSK